MVHPMDSSPGSAWLLTSLALLGVESRLFDETPYAALPIPRIWLIFFSQFKHVETTET